MSNIIERVLDDPRIMVVCLAFVLIGPLVVGVILADNYKYKLDAACVEKTGAPCVRTCR